MSTIRTKHIVLRKDRTCFGCCTPFKKGDRLRVDTITEDGRIYDTYLCLDCQIKVSKMRYDDEFFEGDLKNDTNE
jgi:RNase P subunit RPR2